MSAAESEAVAERIAAKRAELGAKDFAAYAFLALGMLSFHRRRRSSRSSSIAPTSGPPRRPGTVADRARLAEELRGLARDSHARAVLAKAFREAPMANAAEALHALADGLHAGTVLYPRDTPPAEGRAS